MLEKARLLLTGKSKIFDALVCFHHYTLPEQILILALGMKDFPQLPFVELKLSLPANPG